MLNQGTRSTIWVDYFFVLMNQPFAWVPEFLAALERSPRAASCRASRGKQHLPAAGTFLPSLPDSSAFHLEVLALSAQF